MSASSRKPLEVLETHLEVACGADVSLALEDKNTQSKYIMILTIHSFDYASQVSSSNWRTKSSIFVNS